MSDVEARCDHDFNAPMRREVRYCRNCQRTEIQSLADLRWYPYISGSQINDLQAQADLAAKDADDWETLAMDRLGKLNAERDLAAGLRAKAELADKFWERVKDSPAYAVDGAVSAFQHDYRALNPQPHQPTCSICHQPCKVERVSVGGGLDNEDGSSCHGAPVIYPQPHHEETK